MIDLILIGIAIALFCILVVSGTDLIAIYTAKGRKGLFSVPWDEKANKVEATE